VEKGVRTLNKTQAFLVQQLTRRDLRITSN
jgi:hypothetical protein